MTQAQMTLMIRLAGGLDGAMAACEAAGFEMVKNCGSKAKQKDLLLVPTADASAILETLGANPISAGRRELTRREDETFGDGDTLASSCGMPDRG
jgi:hypothetical protein